MVMIMHVKPYNMITPQGRLSLNSTLAVYDESTPQPTLYYTPYVGDGISVIYKSSVYTIKIPTLSLELRPITTNIPVDIFLHWDTVNCSLIYKEWTNKTTRSETLISCYGLWIDDLILSNLYLGTVYLPYYAGLGTLVDCPNYRYIWNCYNRVNRMSQYYSGDSHFYTGPARPWNNSFLSQVSYVVGLVEDTFPFELTFINNENNGTFLYGYGSAFSTPEGFFTNSVPYPITAFLYGLMNPTLGYQQLFAFEWGEATTYWQELVINVLYHG